VKEVGSAAIREAANRSRTVTAPERTDGMDERCVEVCISSLMAGRKRLFPTSRARNRLPVRDSINRRRQNSVTASYDEGRQAPMRLPPPLLTLL
jgi:hypothetical protein